jgi:hypothetical protein
MEVWSYLVRWRSVCILVRKLCEIWVQNWIQLDDDGNRIAITGVISFLSLIPAFDGSTHARKVHRLSLWLCSAPRV